MLEKYIVCDASGLRIPSVEFSSVLYITPTYTSSMQELIMQEMQQKNYDDVIMTTIASQITILTSVYSTFYSDADQRKHQSSASLAFVWGIHWDRWIPLTKGQLRGKCFHLMTSSWNRKVLLSMEE